MVVAESRRRRLFTYWPLTGDMVGLFQWLGEPIFECEFERVTDATLTPLGYPRHQPP